MFIKKFTKKLTFEYYKNEDPDYTETYVVDCPSFFPFYLRVIQKQNFPYKYKELFLDDYRRQSVCVRYFLPYLFWLTIFKICELNYKVQCFVYYFLRNKLNQNNDFIPASQFVGSWFNMLGHFIKYKFRNSTNSYL